MFVAATLFFVSIVGIAGVFGIKHWEQSAQRVLAPSFRGKLDVRALQVKELLAAARLDLAKLPPAAVRLGRFLIHEAALGLAVLARIAEKQLHRLADLVSHKHRFEKRSTRSEFLKKVAEHKSGSSNGIDNAVDLDTKA